MANKKPNILYIDIENSRMIVEFPTYSLYNIDRIHPRFIKKDWHITCAAWGWLDNTTKTIKGIKAISGLDFPKAFKRDHRDDYGVVTELHKVLSQADLIVGHNSDSFDIKKINYKFIKHGLDPIDMPPTVDTLKAAKKYARASSNSLYYLAKEFNVEMKIDLGAGVMHAADDGCEKSLKKLVTYNKGDIRAGAELYFKLLPYIKNHPNVNKTVSDTFSLETPKCGSCGSSNVYKNGVRKTKTARYQRWVCNDCGSSTKGPKE